MAQAKTKKGPAKKQPRSRVAVSQPSFRRVDPEVRRLVYGPLGPQVVAYSPGSGYSSAVTSREIEGVRAVIASGDAHLRIDLPDMVAESERLSRNNTIYRSLLRRLTDLVVGSGWRVQARTADDGLNSRIESLHEQRVRRIEMRGMDNFLQFQRKLIWHTLVDGRVLLIKDAASGRLQAITGPRLFSLSSRAENGNRIEHGVEIDEFGSPIAFHVAAWDEFGLDHRSITRVPAEHAIYMAPRDRFDETSPSPPLQAIFPFLYRLNDVFDSEAAAWQLMSRLAIKITKRDAAQVAYQTAATTQQSSRKSVSQLTSEMEYGVVFWGEPDEDIGGIERNIPSPDFDRSVKSFLRICGMELGLSLPFFLLDWSEVSFSGGRAAAMQFWRNARVWCDALEDVLRADYEWWVSREVAFGRLPDRADIHAHEWVSDPFQPLDADKENSADKTAISAGLKTVTRCLRERGIDRDEFLRERASELAAAAQRVAEHNAAFPDSPITLAQLIGEEAQNEQAT